MAANPVKRDRHRVAGCSAGSLPRRRCRRGMRRWLQGGADLEPVKPVVATAPGASAVSGPVLDRRLCVAPMMDWTVLSATPVV